MEQPKLEGHLRIKAPLIGLCNTQKWQQNSVVTYTPFPRYSRLWNRLSNGFDNHVEQTVCSFNTVVKPVWQPAVYTIQPFVKPNWQSVWQRVWQLVVSCIQTFTRLSNRKPVWQQVVSCKRGFTKHGHGGKRKHSHEWQAEDFAGTRETSANMEKCCYKWQRVGN